MPGPSLQSIRKICQHYEAKCQGQYSSLASRYVLQMSKEIQSQIDAMEQEEEEVVGQAGAPPAYGGGFFKRSRSSTSRRGSTATNNTTTRRVSIASGTKYGNGGGDATRRRSSISGMEVGGGGGSRRHLVREEIRDCFDDVFDANDIWGGGMNAGGGGSKRRLSAVSSVYSVYPELIEMKDLLDRTKEELQQKSTELEENEIEFNQKLQIERRHFRNTREALIQQHQQEILKLSKEIMDIKKDAKIVIDFVRKRANEALGQEMEKRKYEKRRMDKELEERENSLKERFNRSLENVEKQVKHALRYENFTTIGRKQNNTGHNETGASSPPSSVDSNMPPPPRPTLGAMKQQSSNRIPGSHLRVQIPSDNSANDDSVSDDSLSTDDQRHFNFSDKRQWFKERINELDEWTDTIAKSLRSIGISDLTSSSPTSRLHPPSPPPIKRISASKRWDL